MSSVTFSVDTAGEVDLQHLQEWTCWAPGRGGQCLVGRDDPRTAFREGRLRVIVARLDGERAGISLLASPDAAEAPLSWRLRGAVTVPSAECLLWVGMAICSRFRQSGLAPALVRRTLDMAPTTGYPFIAAAFPVDDARASTLLVRAGFSRVEAMGDDRSLRERVVYLRSTPNLMDQASALAC